MCFFGLFVCSWVVCFLPCTLPWLMMVGVRGRVCGRDCLICPVTCMTAIVHPLPHTNNKQINNRSQKIKQPVLTATKTSSIFSSVCEELLKDTRESKCTKIETRNRIQEGDLAPAHPKHCGASFYTETN